MRFQSTCLLKRIVPIRRYSNAGKIVAIDEHITNRKNEEVVKNLSTGLNNSNFMFAINMPTGTFVAIDEYIKNTVGNEVKSLPPGLYNSNIILAINSV